MRKDVGCEEGDRWHERQTKDEVRESSAAKSPMCECKTPVAAFEKISSACAETVTPDVTLQC